jgi:hypothetical protein
MTTEEFHKWLKIQDDQIKMRFAINWRIPHSVFNVACLFLKCEDLQGIDWYKIHKSCDLGNWSNAGNSSGGKVYVLGD